ncbi:hypothetical protein CK203_023922 [Vitis vinifera]|uniref:Retrotransposon gag domain-containing protein n=1 Tax=Vitis vinifera TaxID=29760 RepID=A0A438J9X9_VITVI|nr:hypothetical protein CK203_023922 [Vitis vinifera]
MRARLGPQAPGKKRPPMVATWEMYPNLPIVPTAYGNPPHKAKFSTYDGSSDLFDHIMHYQQLMTLDIGNNALLCKRLLGCRQGKQSHPELPPLTPLTVSYEKLLPMIPELSDFRWPGPIKADPAKRDDIKTCAYHKEHGHTTEQCRSLHYLVERLIRVGHLKQYIRSEAKEGRLLEVKPPGPPGL